MLFISILFISFYVNIVGDDLLVIRSATNLILQVRFLNAALLQQKPPLLTDRRQVVFSMACASCSISMHMRHFYKNKNTIYTSQMRLSSLTNPFSNNKSIANHPPSLTFSPPHLTFNQFLALPIPPNL